MGRSENAVVKSQSPKMVVAERPREAQGANQRAVVRGFILRVIGDPFLADDLVQETLLRAHKSGATFKGRASRTTWLCTIALNVMRDHFRATARRPTQVSDPQMLLALKDEEMLEDDLLQNEMNTCIRRYVLLLPEHQRDVVALHDIAGLTHREISASLGISQSNSRTLLHRGRAALKLLFEENCILSFDDSVPCQRKPD